MSRNLIIGIVVFSLILIVGSYFLVAGGNNSANVVSYSKNSKEKPVAQVKENFADFGKIKVKDIKEKEFTLKNTGNKPLQLFDLTSSCNCTAGQIVYQGKSSKEFGMHAPSEATIEIAPDTEAKVRVIYRPFVMPVYGVVEREVYASTNDPSNPKLILKIKAFVE